VRRRAVERLLRKLLQYPKRPALIMLGAFPHRYYNPGCAAASAPKNPVLTLSYTSIDTLSCTRHCAAVYHNRCAYAHKQIGVNTASLHRSSNSRHGSMHACRQPHQRLQEFYKTAEDEQVRTDQAAM